MKIERTLLATRKIGEINEALFIIKHFMKLSAKLLPYLQELSDRPELSEQDVSDKHKIIKVYLNYSFDTATSEHLLNSEILLYIQQTFRSILTKSEDSKIIMNEFLHEYDRLQKKWSLVDCN